MCLPAYLDLSIKPILGIKGGGNSFLFVVFGRKQLFHTVLQKQACAHTRARSSTSHLKRTQRANFLYTTTTRLTTATAPISLILFTSKFCVS